MNIKIMIFLIRSSIPAFLSGSIVASAMTCLGDRLVVNESWMKGRSHCDVCGHELKAIDLIPIFSYLLTKGHCRYCGAKFSKKYVITELVTGLLFVIIFFQEGRINFTVIRNWGVVAALMALSIIDFYLYIIPNQFIIFLILWWLLFSVFGHADIVSGLSGGVVISGFVLAISLIMDRILQKESIGGGDIKLLFAAGLYLGISGGLLMIIIACITGLLFVLLMKNSRIPFGPSISIAFLLVMLFGSHFIRWYLAFLF